MLHLTIVIDLFSRKVVGWSMKNNLRVDLVINALLNNHNLELNMCLRDNCHDNAVVDKKAFSLC